MVFVSKKQAHRARVGFKHGNTPAHKGKCRGYVKETNVRTRFVRLDKDAFESRIFDDEGVLTFRDVDNSVTSVSSLRPLNGRVDYVDRYRGSQVSQVHTDLLTNKVYVPALLQSMMAKENKMHRSINEKCRGDLVIDGNASVKWGLGWQERLRCTKCRYVGNHYKLYNEVERKGFGRRAAQINVGLQIGIASTSIGNTGTCRILNTANIISPSKSSMQKGANKVSAALQAINENSMKQIRHDLVEENAKIGQQDPHMFNVEGDSCYNNPLFNSEATPFQSGTVVTTTFCENNTRNKKILGVHVGSKLCAIGSRLRNRGSKVLCPNHRGHCSANVLRDQAIGDEGTWNCKVASDISKEVKVANFTCDGDSKGFKGVQSSQKHNVGHLKDLRHLGNSLRRELYKAPFSKGMLTGHTKSNIRSRFALSVKSRCMAELKSAHKKHRGNIKVLKRVMPKVISTMIMCFRGYCGTECRKHSFVCSGNHSQSKNYLPSNVRVKMTANDQTVLHKCIEMVLGPTSLDATRLLTTTQKCEAVNRSFQTVHPKTMTFSRTCVGRIHGQVHTLNIGFGSSVVLKTAELNAHLTRGSRVIEQLAAIDRLNKHRRLPSQVTKAKVSRARARQIKYKMHEDMYYKKGITDPKPDFSNLPHLAHHDYA